MMSTSTWINVILAALLLAVGGWAWWTRRTSAATSATGGAAAGKGEGPKKLDVFKRLEPVERFAIRYYITVAALICVFALSLAARKRRGLGRDRRLPARGLSQLRGRCRIDGSRMLPRILVRYSEIVATRGRRATPACAACAIRLEGH